jgi:hypothetical protein
MNSINKIHMEGNEQLNAWLIQHRADYEGETMQGQKQNFHATADLFTRIDQLCSLLACKGYDGHFHLEGQCFSYGFLDKILKRRAVEINIYSSALAAPFPVTVGTQLGAGDNRSGIIHCYFRIYDDEKKGLYVASMEVQLSKHNKVVARNAMHIETPDDIVSSKASIEMVWRKKSKKNNKGHRY